jgi:hypothetical protein
MCTIRINRLVHWPNRADTLSAAPADACRSKKHLDPAGNGSLIRGDRGKKMMMKEYLPFTGV